MGQAGCEARRPGIQLVRSRTTLQLQLDPVGMAALTTKILLLRALVFVLMAGALFAAN